MDAMTIRASKSQAVRDMAALRMRQLALFAGILMSGGLQTIPREPLLVLVLAICFAFTNPLRMFKAEFGAIWILLLATVAVALLGGQSFQIAPMLIRYSNFLAGLALLAMYIDRRPGAIAEDLYIILKLMAFQAVLTPLFALIVPQLFTTFMYKNTIYTTFLYIFTYHEFIVGATLFKRPDGFFFEPGVFQIYLNIFLFICLFLRRFSYFDVGLATLAVMATQSTTGAAILVMLYCVAYWRFLKTAGRMQKLAVLIVGPILLLPIATYATYNLAEKFYGEFSGSAEAREYDLRTGLNVVMENPLTGIGFDYERYFDVAQEVGYRDLDLSDENMTERSNSNGIVTLLYSIGIPLGLVFLWGALRQRMFRPRLLMAGLVLLSMTSEPLIFTPFILMIVFSGLLLKTRKAPQARAATARTRGALAVRS